MALPLDVGLDHGGGFGEACLDQRASKLLRAHARMLRSGSAERNGARDGG